MALLTRPTTRVHASFLAAMSEFMAEGRRITRPSGFVPRTTLWWVSEDEYLARIAIRHRLTPRLRDYGGHIGYDVRPSARRYGHATAMLAAALPVANALGIDPVLITCDENNIGSRKVIEASGGTLEDQRGINCASGSQPRSPQQSPALDPAPTRP